MQVSGVLGVGMCALAAASFPPSSATAATTTYYHAGDWAAFSGTTEQNRLVCGMSTGNPADGRSLEVSAIIGEPRLEFTASKPTWDIPQGTAIPVVMQVSGAVPWTVEATGRAHAMSWSLSETEASAFGGAFRAASEMTISFPSGSEPPWRVLLTGSSAVDGTFRRCITDYTARAAAAAQPQGPTQPFGSPATQPFTPPIAATPLQPPTAPQAQAPQAPAPQAPAPQAPAPQAPGPQASGPQAEIAPPTPAVPPLPPIPAPAQPEHTQPGPAR